MRRPRRPWRYARLHYARLHFTLYWVSEDVAVSAQAGPTPWGPWRALGPAELERVKRLAGPMAGWIRQHPVLGDQLVAVVRLPPMRREGA